MTEYEHESTIGHVDHGGTRFEIDWPFQLDDPTRREEYANVVANGKDRGDFVHPDWMNGRALDDPDEIMELAREYIERGAFDD